MSMPEFLIELLNKQYGKEVTNQIINGYKQKRKVTFRVNTLKSSIPEIEEVLNNLKISYEKVSWSEEAFIINELKEKNLEELDIYKEGKIYMQSLSSMLPPIILKPKEGSDILDMAAAPGGKTTQIAALTNNKSHITACEMNAIRAERLKYNIEKQGTSCVYIMQKDSRKIDDFFSFDQILLDAPCSGSGTISLDSEINITENFINKISRTQFNLLDKAIKILKNGQEMVYSTCSILSKENEENIEKILKKYNLEIVPIELEGISEIPVLPTKIPGTLVVAPNELYEGFFVAKLKKCPFGDVC